MTPCGGPAGVEADKIRTELGINYHMVRKESADPKLTVSCGPHCRNTIMKLTKNAAALLLAASLAVSVCATPVFADGGTTTPPPNMGSTTTGSDKVQNGIAIGNTNVLYNVTESYQWSVPATIDFGENAGANNTSTVNATLDENKPGEKAKQDTTNNKWKGTAPKVVVSKNVIGIGKKLQITVNTTYYDNGEFYVLSGSSEKLFYTVTKLDATGATGEKLTQTNTEVLSVPSGTDTAAQKLVFELETAKGTNVSEKAGKYEGVVVFESRIV